ncbi:putative toxin-antitoxin system toxin component, PIN family [Kyrpidia spormannii]|uniref:Uncharacterized protein n=1 Tax=Kyrpidia spormannii TaxID=2055160 RepID=A0ACA8ZDW7_9BACL|nr:protein of unknown function [Kyrpidia spormannii]
MTRLWCLDTNVLVSGLVFQGPEHVLIRQLQHYREPILWFPTLESELQEVLARKFALTDVDWPSVFPRGTRMVVPEAPPDLIKQAIEDLRDPKDGPILAAARFYKADFLVTGDRDLLVLAPMEKTLRILTTKEASCRNLGQDITCNHEIAPGPYNPSRRPADPQG